MERLTNTARKHRNARNSREAGIMSEERKIDPSTTCFGGKGNASIESVKKSFTGAAKKQQLKQQG